MIGGTDLRTLRIIAEEADMISFFTHTMTHGRTQAPAGHHAGMARKAGRNPDDIEVTGMTKVYPASSQSESDALAHAWRGR